VLVVDEVAAIVVAGELEVVGLRFRLRPW